MLTVPITLYRQQILWCFILVVLSYVAIAHRKFCSLSSLFPCSLAFSMPIYNGFIRCFIFDREKSIFNGFTIRYKCLLPSKLYSCTNHFVALIGWQNWKNTVVNRNNLKLRMWSLTMDSEFKVTEIKSIFHFFSKNLNYTRQNINLPSKGTPHHQFERLILTCT